MTPLLTNASAITVLKLDISKTPLEQAADLNRQDTSDPLLTGVVTYDDTATHAQGGKINTTYTDFKKKPPKSTKADLNIELDKGAVMYNANAGIIEAVARKAAADGGDINIGIKLVENSGYYLKSPKESTTKEFSGSCEGSGSIKRIKIETPSVGIGATYIRKWFKVTAVGVIPTEVNEFMIGEATIYLESVDALSVYAFCEASILPITRKPQDGTPETKLAKKATKKSITNAHRRSFNANDTTYYNWGKWIWVTT